MIVLAAYSLSQVKILEAAAKAMEKRGDETMIVSFNDQAVVNVAIRERAEADGLKFADFSAVVNDFILPTLELTNLHALTSWIPTEEELSYRAMLFRQLGAAGKLLDDVLARMLIVCEDGPGGCGPLIAAAKQRQLPVLDMPFGIGESRDYDNFVRDKAREGNLNIVPVSSVGTNLRRHAGHWIRTVDQGDITMMPAEFILARVAVGLDIDQPWVVHGGAADALLVESEAMKRIYLREGVPLTKLVMTGSLYADTVAAVLASDVALANSAATGGRVDAERFKVLIAPPPSYHNSHSHVAEFATYQESVERLVAAAKCDGRADVTVSLHPATTPQDREVWLKQEAVFSDQWVLELIPRHDVLVTAFSSTTRWAIACSKPVVNYDMYKFNLSTYEGVSGVVELRDMSAVERVLMAMASDDETYARLSARQRLRSREWGVLDGRSLERILSEVDRRLSRFPSKTASYKRTSIYTNRQPAQPKHMFIWLGDLVAGRHPRLASLLDVGAAAGEFLAYAGRRFPQAKMLGVELDASLVALANEHGVPVVQGDANHLTGIATSQFEAVLMTGTHSIFEDFRPSIAECLRVARAGGTVLVTGLFNPYPLDARIHWRYPAHWDAQWNPGYNMASMDSVRLFLSSQPRVESVEFLPFELPFDLLPQADPVRSWTELDDHGVRRLRNGIMHLPLHCLVIGLRDDN
ncbi:MULTISPECIES: class I SAM-dependent methyltransferase [unclassified Bradyrhizobium]|uniref:class I SAM-dependent methyltransferase n=1 Tax=unclassified Bradyrhizobium TaxID=2631580 RepID=UPI00070AC518|nr:MULTISPECIES: class I SAM-dependent methyltransferase [unclassified Bradyrhizobium]KQT07366.1 hypothetical protein ASG57_35760 [Bradyrhizobium sp. Leaf396]